ncbi:MAG: hypothetical protein QXF34_02610 [Desulfurococcaceae archaeon]
MNKLIIIAIAVIIVIVVASIYLLFIPKHGMGGEGQSFTTETQPGVETTETTISETTHTTPVRVCPVNGVRANAYTELNEIRGEQGYSYTLTISIIIINDLNETIKIRSIVIDNKTFINMLLQRLWQYDIYDYDEDLYGLIMNYEDKPIVIKSGEYEIVSHTIRLPDPILQFWERGTQHSVEVIYEINGLKCSIKTPFVIS